MILPINKLVIDCRSPAVERDEGGYSVCYKESRLWLRLLFLFKGTILIRLQNTHRFNLDKI